MRVVPDVVKPDDPVHPRSLDRHLALQLQTELDEERDGGPGSSTRMRTLSLP
jgi:hypothetical protein